MQFPDYILFIEGFVKKFEMEGSMYCRYACKGLQCCILFTQSFLNKTNTLNGKLSQNTYS